MSSSLIGGSESNSLSMPQTAGAQTSQGSATTINMGTNYKSNPTVNVSLTDHGAIGAAMQAVTEVAAEMVAFGKSLVSGNTDVVNNALETNEYVTGKAIDSNRATVMDAFAFGQDAFRQATDLVRETTYEAFDFGQNSLNAITDTVSGALASNRSITRDALHQSAQVIQLTEELNEQNTDLVRSVTTSLGNTTGLVVQTLGDIEEERTIQNVEVLKAVKGLAEVVQTGGESINANINKVIVFAALGLAGFVAWRVAR